MVQFISFGGAGGCGIGIRLREIGFMAYPFDWIKTNNLNSTNITSSNISGTNVAATNVTGINLSGINIDGTNINGENIVNYEYNDGSWIITNLDDQNYFSPIYASIYLGQYIFSSKHYFATECCCKRKSSFIYRC